MSRERYGTAFFGLSIYCKFEKNELITNPETSMMKSQMGMIVVIWNLFILRNRKIKKKSKRAVYKNSPHFVKNGVYEYIVSKRFRIYSEGFR